MLRFVRGIGSLGSPVVGDLQYLFDFQYSMYLFAFARMICNSLSRNECAMSSGWSGGQFMIPEEGLLIWRIGILPKVCFYF